MSADLVAAIDAAIAFVHAHPDEMTRSQVDEFKSLAADVYRLAHAANLLDSLPKVEELRPQLETPSLGPVQFESKLHLPGDWVRPQGDDLPLLPSWYAVEEEPSEIPESKFLVGASPQSRWFEDMDLLRSLAESNAAPTSVGGGETTEALMAQVVEAVGDDNAGRILIIAQREDLSVDERMRAIVTLDSLYKYKTSTAWNKLLRVKNVRGTAAWKEWHPQKPKDEKSHEVT